MQSYPNYEPRFDDEKVFLEILAQHCWTKYNKHMAEDELYAPFTNPIPLHKSYTDYLCYQPTATLPSSLTHYSSEL